MPAGGEWYREKEVEKETAMQTVSYFVLLFSTHNIRNQYLITSQIIVCPRLVLVASDMSNDFPLWERRWAALGSINPKNRSKNYPRTNEVFLCFLPFVFLSSFVPTSLFFSFTSPTIFTGPYFEDETVQWKMYQLVTIVIKFKSISKRLLNVQSTPDNSNPR